MTKHWFTCKVRYVKEDQNGGESKVTEQYLLDAYNYTEAESRMTYLLEQMGRRPYEVQQITKSNYAEVVRYDDGDLWFRVKVSFVSFDENKGEEKSSNQYFLVSAGDVRDAFDKTSDFLKSSMAGYVIPAISYTKLVDVFPLAEEDASERMIRERNLQPVSTPEETYGHYDQETGEVLD